MKASPLEKTRLSEERGSGSQYANEGEYPGGLMMDSDVARLRQSVLVVTSEWPVEGRELLGIHVVNQVAALRETGMNVDIFPFRGRKNPIRYLRAIINLHRLELHKYDLIHAHHGQSGIVALAQRQLPVVVTFHGSDVLGIRNQNGRMTVLGRVLRETSRLVARRADAAIIVAEHMKRYLPDISFRLIPAGIDTELFRPIPRAEARRALGMPLDSRLVLFVGDPSRPEKRFDLARSAMDLLNRHLSAELIVIHQIPHTQVPLYMNACDILLVTSLSEGSPNAVKEALACNLNIVSTDVGDISRRVGDTPGCAICVDDQPETIANALLETIKDLRRIDGRAHVRDLDERFLVLKVIDVYQAVLSGDN